MARMPSIQQHNFARVPEAQIPRSSFDRSHGLKTAFDSGYLIPIFLDEALPGDTFNLNMTGFARLATPLHPFMDNVYFNTFFFSVPIRLIDENWQKLMGEQRNPGDSTDYLSPIIQDAGGFGQSTLYDFLGIPDVGNIPVSAYPLRAYNLIWNEWFRDQNLQTSVATNVGAGPDPSSDYVLKRRGKRHDYFTSALPWPQKGPAVDLPLGTSAPITGLGIVTGQTPTVGPLSVWETAGGTGYTDYYPSTATTGGPSILAIDALSSATDSIPQIFANLSDATAATINQLRQAFQLQKLYERDARGGTRYTEIIRAHFNVISPDARLLRPEYLGGGQSIVNLHTVPQTSGTTSQPTPQGNLAAYGTATMSGHGFTTSFTEHCIVIGLVSVRADLNYQQGLPRMWSRRTKWDYYWPALAMIGEQAILNKEIYATGTAGIDNAVFGYQERWAEYRYKPSLITGAMRSTHAASLDTWHLAQDFASLPALNAAFIEDNPPIARVIAVPSEPQFIFDAFFKFRCARPMPIYGVPGLIDHF